MHPLVEQWLRLAVVAMHVVAGVARGAVVVNLGLPTPHIEEWGVGLQLATRAPSLGRPRADATGFGRFCSGHRRRCGKA